ncbi:MAG: hexokinase [bacterium]|nr:hexokinase [bacterium]
MAISTNLPVACKEFENYLNKLFNISDCDIRTIIKDFHSEMQKGLSGYESSLKMIPAFVDRPKGNEKGKFIALDLGGTNFRVLEVELDGKGNSSVLAVSKFVIKKKDMQGTGDQLFDFIADSIKSFMQENSISCDKQIELAFTFSFPVEQTNIAAGTLIVWTKGFTAKGVVGEDIVIVLNEALKRKGISNVKVAALANDTVGTLVAKSYNVPSCDIGVILGTGSNACYPEKMSNITKWRGVRKKDNMIINMEWGNFDKLPITTYDKEIDKASPNTGRQRLEKLVSGMYLGEILRQVISDLIQRDLIFKDYGTNVFHKPYGLLTEHMSLIEGDNSDNLGEIENFLVENGIANINLHSKVLLKKLCHLVSARSARISATAISAIITWMDPELKKNHTVGIDGSLFEKYPGFKGIMEEVFEELFKDKAKKITLELAKDGSGKGAAIIAAVAASSEK